MRGATVTPLTLQGCQRVHLGVSETTSRGVTVTPKVGIKYLLSPAKTAAALGGVGGLASDKGNSK